jgi:hypothetical protein
MVDTAETNGTLYIGQANGKDGFYVHQATIDGDHYIESAVLAGPVSFPGTITVTGNLVIV